MVDKRNALLANAMKIDEEHKEEIAQLNKKIAKLESFINAESKPNKK